MASTIAKAYVQIVPSTQGMSSNIKSALNSGGYDDVGQNIGGSITKGISSSMVSAGLGGLIGGMIGGAITQAVSQAMSSIGKVLVESVMSGGDFEQFTGGMEKIFSGMDVSQILNDAKNAYEELGMSVNDYLEKINDVGATFKATMGSEVGYETARKGLMAISDYATGTGKDLGTLTEKFTMITRSTSSYQSIADQFSGILPATSKAFLEQSQAAGTLSESYKTLSDVPIAEYQMAVVDALERGVSAIGLTGNTSEEAASTFSGSLQQMKSAWENLKTSLTSEDMDTTEMAEKFAESVKIFLENLAPMIEEMIPSLVEAFSTIGSELSPIMTELLINIMTSLAEKMPEIIFRMVAAMSSAMLKQLGNTVVQMGTLLAAGPILAVKSIGSLVTTTKDTFSGMGESISKSLSNIKIGDVFDNIKEKISGIKENISNAFQGINLSGIKDNISNVFDNIVTSASGMVSSVSSVVSNIGSTISNAFSSAVSGVSNAMGSIGSAVMNGLRSASSFVSSWGSELATKGANAISNMANAIVKAITDIPRKLKQLGQNMAEGLAQGFTDKVNSIISNFTRPIEEIVDKIKGMLGIHSPSRVFADEIGSMMAAGLMIGFNAEMPKVNASIKSDLTNSLRMEKADIRSALAQTSSTNGLGNSGSIVEQLSKAMQNITVQNNVTLEGDAGKLFTAMQNQNRTYRNTTGRSAFA